MKTSLTWLTTPSGLNPFKKIFFIETFQEFSQQQMIVREDFRLKLSFDGRFIDEIMAHGRDSIVMESQHNVIQ